MVSYLACTSRLVSVFLFNSLDLIFPLASLELWRKRCLSNHTRSPHNAGLFSCAPSMGAHLRVQVPLQAGHSEQSEAQLRKGDRAWEGSAERKS